MFGRGIEYGKLQVCINFLYQLGQLSIHDLKMVEAPNLKN
jgi:hypothetical protein